MKQILILMFLVFSSGLAVAEENNAVQQEMTEKLDAKQSPSIRLKVREEETGAVIQKEAGITGDQKNAAVARLLADGRPTVKVDLDSARYAKLAFQISYPAENQDYDGWNFTVKRKGGQVVALVKQTGQPPLYIDWSQVKDGVSVTGVYTYQLNLYKDESEYLGVESKFIATEGLNLAQHDYVPDLVLEPRTEVGYFTFHGNNSFDVSGSYLGVEIPLVYQQKYLMNLGANTALSSTDAVRDLSEAHASVGLEFYKEKSSLFGIPYFGRFDLSARFTRFALPPRSLVSSVSLVGIVLEPQWVIYGRHYLQPSLSVSVGSGSMHAGAGLSYSVPVRAWSMRWGFGLEMESLFKYDADPSAKFTLFRMMTHFSFII